MTQSSTSAEQSREWAQALGVAWRKDFRRAEAWLALLKESGCETLDAPVEQEIAARRSELAPFVPRWICGFLHQLGDPAKGAEGLMSALAGTEQAWSTHAEWYEKLLGLYLGMAQAIAYHSGLYETAAHVPITWVHADDQSRRLMPPIMLGETKKQPPWKKCVRIRTIANALRASGQDHPFVEVVNLLDAICGVDRDISNRKWRPAEPLLGFCDAWTSSMEGAPYSLGSTNKSFRNLIHDFDTEGKVGIELERMPMFGSVLLYLFFLPWKYLTLIHRPMEAPGSYASSSGGQEIHAGQPALSGSAVDAAGWTGYLLWLTEKPLFDSYSACPWAPSPGSAPGPQAFRLMSLFPLFLSPDQYDGGSLKGARHPLHVVGRVNPRPSGLDLEVVWSSPEVVEDTVLHSPVPLDARSSRTLLWIEMTAGPKQSEEFLELLKMRSAAEGPSGRLDVRRATTGRGGFPARVHGLHLPAGPIRCPATAAPGRVEPFEAAVDCVLVYRPAPEGTSELLRRQQRSWLLPRIAVRLVLDDDVLDELVESGTGEARPAEGSGGITAHYIYLLPQTTETASHKLQARLGELLDRPVRESPWVPDLRGKGNLCIRTANHWHDWPIIMEVHRGGLDDLLHTLDTAVTDIARRGHVSPLQRPEVMIPWMLWVIVSASRGLDVLARKRQESRLWNVPIDPSHLRTDATGDGFEGWWRLFDLEAALSDLAAGSVQRAPRWHLRGADDAVGGRAALAILAHDLLYFAQHLAVPAGAPTWGELAKGRFAGWGASGCQGLSDSQSVAQALAARLGAHGDAVLYPTVSQEAATDFQPLPHIRRSEALSQRLDDSLGEFRICLAHAIDQVREDYCAAVGRKGASGRSPQALEDAMNAALHVSDVFQLSAYVALAEAARDDDFDRYGQVRDYLFELSRWGPYWSRPDGGSQAQTDGGPFVARGVVLASALRSEEWRDGLDELVATLRVGFAQTDSNCSIAGQDVSCHRSFAATCPCTNPIRRLLHQLPRVWDRPSIPSPQTSAHLAMAGLERLAEMALAAPETKT